ncbi:MAG: polyprenyl synthetase family protein [Opitutae bacterium]|jgi:octaprenyl-diphosphate synthase|nr:polyprenyl synthetase family protein [Opitutae bacterium]
MNSISSSPAIFSSTFFVDSETSKFLSFFESYLSDLLDSIDQPIRDLAKHASLGGGKRIRPFLLYTCGNGKSSTEDLLKASAVIELIHVATLVHDDILDLANLRRGKATLHSKYGEHPAILLGDALFSFALELASEFPSTNICKIVSKATRRTCSGEIQQSFSKGDFSLTIEDYYSIIQDKTGELFNASCSIGSYLGGANENLIDLVGDFGTSLGLNYQIYDDLVDTFGDNSNFGKTLGTDFESGKVTLPFIILMKVLSKNERDSLKSSLNDNNFSSDFRCYLAELFKSHNIQESCIDELINRFNQSKLIASNIPNHVLSTRLLRFLETFNLKISSISEISEPNFLALK